MPHLSSYLCSYIFEPNDAFTKGLADILYAPLDNDRRRLGAEARCFVYQLLQPIEDRLPGGINRRRCSDRHRGWAIGGTIVTFAGGG